MYPTTNVVRAVGKSYFSDFAGEKTSHTNSAIATRRENELIAPATHLMRINWHRNETKRRAK